MAVRKATHHNNKLKHKRILLFWGSYFEPKMDPLSRWAPPGAPKINPDGHGAAWRHLGGLLERLGLEKICDFGKIVFLPVFFNFLKLLEKSFFHKRFSAFSGLRLAATGSSAGGTTIGFPFRLLGGGPLSRILSVQTNNYTGNHKEKSPP